MVDFEDLKEKLRGPSVLVMTPFKDDLELNIEALEENIQFIIDGGIGDVIEGSIICPCANGEYKTLSREENIMVVEAAVGIAGDKLPVVAGVSSCNYKEVIEKSLNAAEAGAKCVMIPPPYYYPISQNGIYRWYKLIAEGIGDKIGIMGYPHPWRVYTGGGISASLLGRLAEIESIVSFKWGMRSLNDDIAALDLHSEKFSLLHNSIVYSREVPHMHGEVGFVSGIGAFWPKYEVDYWNLLEEGKYDEASRLNSKVSPFNEFCSGRGAGCPGTEGPFPLFTASVIKTALEYVGLYGGPVRPPFVDLTVEQKSSFFGVLECIGVPKKR